MDLGIPMGSMSARFMFASAFVPVPEPCSCSILCGTAVLNCQKIAKSSVLCTFLGGMSGCAENCQV